jgi:hypothetical protein
MTIVRRFGWALAGAIALALIATVARVIQAGPLDPPGPVGSTMKTIGDLVPAWHQTLTSSGCGSARWSCVMGGAAVLDNETGLVWEQTPSNAASQSWGGAQSSCASAATGNRSGWRVPSIEELQSLYTVSSGDGLPAGHPFTGAGSHYFWTSSDAPDDERSSQYVFFGPGSVPLTVFKEVAVAGAWCVRGGRGENAQSPSDLNSWSRGLSASGLDSCHSPRFTCVLGGAGVLDRNTGLVWERNMLSPSAQGINSTETGGDNADQNCLNDETGGVRGWRLPTAPELLSLYDPSQALSGGWVLPPGHPFIVPLDGNTGRNVWWTTMRSADGTFRVFVRFHEDVPNVFPPGMGAYVLGVSAHLWCVRGSVAR